MVQNASRVEASGSAAEERRRDILVAASRLFRAHGLHAVGMREIAGELGMTAGSLYYYFADKQALLAYCQESTLDALLARGRAIAIAAEPPQMRLRRLVVAHAVTLNEAQPGSLAHLEIEALDPSRRAPLLAKRKRYERLIRQLIQEGVAEGSLAVDDAGLATLSLLGALNWSVKWFRASGPLSASEVGERFADLFLKGLEARRAN